MFSEFSRKHHVLTTESDFQGLKHKKCKEPVLVELSVLLFFLSELVSSLIMDG